MASRNGGVTKRKMRKIDDMSAAAEGDKCGRRNTKSPYVVESVAMACVNDNINNILPESVLMQVLAELNLQQQLRCMSVCKYWRRVITLMLMIRKEIVITQGMEPYGEGLAKTLSLCPTLTHFDQTAIRYCRVYRTRLVPTLTKFCTNLKVLRLNKVKFTASNSVPLAKGLTLLEEFQALRCQLRDEFLAALFASCHQLKVLDISRNSMISSKPFTNMPSGVEKLNIEETGVCDDVFTNILPRCKDTLKYLNASFCEYITRACVELVGQFTNLQHLHMSQLWQHGNFNCPGATTSVFTPLSLLSQLRVLNLHFTFCVHDEAIARIARGCPHLEQLDISDTSREHPISRESCLTPRGLRELRHAKNLVMLDVSHQEFDDSCAEALANLPRLRTLRMENCGPHLTAAGVGMLAHHAASLTDLHIGDFWQTEIASIVQVVQGSGGGRDALLHINVDKFRRWPWNMSNEQTIVYANDKVKVISANERIDSIDDLDDRIFWLDSLVCASL